VCRCRQLTPARKRARPPLPGEVKRVAPPTEPAVPKANPHAIAVHKLAAEVAKATDFDEAKLTDLAVSHATGGRSTSANELDRRTRDMAVLVLCEIRDGKVTPEIQFAEEGSESYALPAATQPTLDGDAA
jgi:hypothetical protein